MPEIRVWCERGWLMVEMSARVVDTNQIFEVENFDSELNLL